MGNSVHLQELTQVVGKYFDQYQLLIAARPVTAAGAARLIFGQSRSARRAMRSGASWFAVKELSGPLYGVLNEQFG